MNKALIEFKSVSLGYGKKEILSGLNLSIYPNDFIGIVGPNGVGKTTILRAIVGILKPLRGEIVYNTKLKFGYVPQVQTIDEIFPFTIYEIVLMGRYSQIGIINKPTREDKEKVLDVLRYFGIEPLSNKLWSELSGGLRQRVLLARALVSDPDVLVLDEPTNDLDIVAATTTMELIMKLYNERGITIIMSSHMLNVVINYVKKIAFIDNKQFVIQDVNSVLTETTLSEVYGIKVKLADVEGEKIIVVKKGEV